jgi:hypothetical protein
MSGTLGLVAEEDVLPAHCVEVVGAEEQASLVTRPPRDALSAQVSMASETERLEELENSIYVSNLRIVDDMTRFAEVTPDMHEPPEEWVRELGPERAAQRFRVAKASWMATKDAPVGITAAKTIVANLAKARATRDAGRQGLQLNVVAVFPSSGARQYEELVVGDD